MVGNYANFFISFWLAFYIIIAILPQKRKPGTKQENPFTTEAEIKHWERAKETAMQTRQRLDKQIELQSVSWNWL